MTMTEALSNGVMTAVVGLAVVFLVLIILMLIIMAMEKIFVQEKPKEEPKKVIASKPEPAKINAPTAAKAPEEKKEEEELIAVLTAAVAASLNTSTYNLRIKSYRRIENHSTAWNRAGVRETINSREI